jgi:hypothetical protein
MRAWIFTALLIFYTGRCAAQDFKTTGNVLLPHCKAFDQQTYDSRPTSSDAFMRGVCVGVIQAIRTVLSSDAVDTPSPVCIPQVVTLGQLNKVAILYMETHPEILHQPFEGTLLLAWREAWPCKR